MDLVVMSHPRYSCAIPLRAVLSGNGQTRQEGGYSAPASYPMLLNSERASSTLIFAFWRDSLASFWQWSQ
jgi:hypothetical protein